MSSVRRKSRPTRTHCQRGHSLTSSTVYVEADGQKRCKLCRSITRNERSKRKRESKAALQC